MMYKSPIEIIYSSIEAQMENEIYKEVLKYGINVDKEELLKALKYDREQYQRGYQDCLKEKVKLLEKQLDIAIKDLCFTVKGADACNYLDDLYEAISERILKQARKEVQE